MELNKIDRIKIISWYYGYLYSLAIWTQQVHMDVVKCCIGYW